MRLNRRQMINMMAVVAAASGLPFDSSVSAEEPKSMAPRVLDKSIPPRSDSRNIVNGTEIPRENYSDQPYVVITKDGNWLCVLTTGPGTEGIPGQHIISTISSDKGKTWSKPIDIEPSKGPEASWVILRLLYLQLRQPAPGHEGRQQRILRTPRRHHRQVCLQVL
jgi:hypothetical protein